MALKLKIGISCYPTVGGSGIIATELGKLLAERGHEIHFITSSRPFRLEQYREMKRIYYHEVKVNEYSVFQYPPYDITLASKMAEVAKRYDLDLIHVHYAVPHAVCGILAKQMLDHKLKIMTTLHGTDITVLGYDPSLREIIRFAIEQSDVVTAVSEDLARQTRELVQTTKPIETVYNFVDERVYTRNEVTERKKRYGIDDEERVFIHISNFRPVKRVPDVIRSFKLISEQMKAKLLLIGEGPDLEEVKRLIYEFDLEDNVLVLGRQNQIADFLSMSDLLLLLSEKESFGLVALEAMACGVPVIATNTGGIPEVVIDGETGYLCDVGAVECIAEKAVHLLTDESRYERFSRAAIKRAKQSFNSKTIVDTYERLYIKMLQQAEVRSEHG